METTVIVGHNEDGTDKTIKLRSSAAVPRDYRIKFNSDIFVDMDKLLTEFRDVMTISDAKKAEIGEDITEEQLQDIDNDTTKRFLKTDILQIFEQIGYIMARAGDPKHTPTDIDEWLNGLETFAIYDILPKILEIWNFETEQRAVQKKE